MKEICDTDICTGCGLCVVNCPKHSISLEEQGNLGHLYPQIDQDTCINCKLCQNNCPALHNHTKHDALAAYAAWSKDEEDYKSSSSGGAASVLSQYVISNGGIVYGCAMLPDIEVKHIRVEEVKDLKKLKGSKYVQSSIVEIIPQLKEDIKQGHLTLFIGTPCQVAAIKSLYIAQPENLILVDLICHGVPSLNLLQEHIKKVAPSPHYDHVSFRVGNDFFLIVTDNELVIYKKSLFGPRYKEWYMNTFFDGYTYRPCCYQCPYAGPERISDITIGDFWGLGQHLPVDEIPPHQNGCSVILPISSKGEQLVNSITSMMNLYGRPIVEAIEGNSQLKAPVYLCKRKVFFRNMYPFIGKSAYYIVNADNILKYQLQRILKRITRK